jgi:hypothetical protein
MHAVHGRAHMSAELEQAKGQWEQRINEANGGMRVTVPVRSRMERRSWEKIDVTDAQPPERYARPAPRALH